MPARPGAQVVLHLATDLRTDTGPSARVTAGVPLTVGTMRWFADHCALQPEQRTDGRASPAVAPSLAGTPPRLEAEGVRVAVLHLSDQVHGMVTADRFIRASDTVPGLAASLLRDTWMA